jgi:hypothetical protein
METMELVEFQLLVLFKELNHLSLRTIQSKYL